MQVQRAAKISPRTALSVGERERECIVRQRAAKTSPRAALTQLSIEIRLEEERKALEEGGEEAAAAVREARSSDEGLLKALCRLPVLGSLQRMVRVGGEGTRAETALVLTISGSSLTLANVRAHARVRRKRERQRRAFQDYKHSLLQPGEMPKPGAALAARQDVSRRVAAVHKRMMARIQVLFAVHSRVRCG